MKESPHISFSSKNVDVQSVSSSKKSSRGCLIAAVPKTSMQKSIKRMDSLFHSKPGLEFAGHIAFFLLKVAALEVVRRFSRAKCPFVWQSIQALQLLCYPPLKWIQRWTPLKTLVTGIQQLSRPLLFLSVATAFSDHSESSQDNSNAHDATTQPYIEPPVQHGEEHQTRDSDSDDSLQTLASQNWLLQLYKELENQKLTLPERITEDDLLRFYKAANNDFPTFLTSIKKTIKWRSTYTILTPQELSTWSHLVFWHNRDKNLRPCLFVRLGLASSTLPFQNRPRFTQAIVSQIEHGVLHLITPQNPQITVLMDCQGLSPFNFPMQMLRSCSSLVQDHYPNHLGCLFIVRLPPVVRVVAQTFIQVLKPVTRQKLKIIGDDYLEVLSECLQSIPTFLGGDCGCSLCCPSPRRRLGNEESDVREIIGNLSNDVVYSSYRANVVMDSEYDQMMKKAVIAILMVLIFVGFIGAMYGPEIPFLS